MPSQLDVPVATSRLILAAHEVADWPALHRLASDPDVMRYITGGLPFEEEHTRAFVNRQERHFAEHGFCRWKLLLRTTREYVGFCGAEHKHLDGEWVPEIGWWLAKEHWGKGLASEAAATAFQHLWEAKRIPRLTACAMPENRASIRVMEKIGLRFEKEFLERSPLTGDTIRLVMHSISRS